MSDMGRKTNDGRSVAASPPRKSGNWRRKWVRAPAQKRRQAAAALPDLFLTRRHPGGIILAVLLLAAAGLHGGLLPFVKIEKGRDIVRMVAKDSYLRKVIQKERARSISRSLSGRITMPPPPEDPEEFVSKTMGDSLTTDIEKVIGSMLDVEVTKTISGQVSASLKDELKAAAKKMADQELSKKEIEAIQEDFRRKAHAAALGALREHRIKTQVKRAAISTTQWYEEKVCRVLFKNLHYEMYRRPGWAAGPRLWYTTWSGGNGTPHWHGLHSADALDRKLRYMERVVDGLLPVERADRHNVKAKTDARGRKFVKDTRGRNIAVIHAGWPGPSLQQARYIKQGLLSLYNRTAGGYKNQSIIPSWNDYLYNGPQCYGLMTEFYPHRREEIKPRTDELDALWRKAFDELETYVQLAEEGEDAEALKPAQQAFFKTIREVFKRCRELLAGSQRACHTINRTLLLTRLREPDLQKKHYRRWVDKMVETLSPLIRAYAEGQFEQGIIQRDGTVEKALEKFPSTMLPLLRRDVKRLLPREKFNRLIFYPFRYRSLITGERCPPSDADYQAERKSMAAALKADPKLKAYADERRKLLARHFHDAVTNTVQVIRKHIFARGLLTRNINALAEGVDYSDKVQERLDARKAAKEGRGQDLARLSKDGLPDPSARLVALQYGLSKGGLVEPVLCPQRPGFITETFPGAALRGGVPRRPPTPAKWGRVTQAEIPCPFRDSPAFEAIPFLSRFPRLDGDLRDWGMIRPLVLTPYGDLVKDRYRGRPIILYAAWNYQGFFFGYQVHQPVAEFFYPEQYRTKARRRPSWAGGGFTGRVRAIREKGFNWMCRGDHLRLLFDTLDARSVTRGDRHTQEFVVIPMGSDTDPTLPGFERIISSKRDAEATEWRRIIASGRGFLPQPPPEHGPDGTGPYRATRMHEAAKLEDQGYTVEVFIPRSLFRVPVFAPGWHIGFDCAVAVGGQGEFRGQYWSRGQDAVPGDEGVGVSPRKWGDVLLLGTDPFLAVQDADRKGTLTKAVVPGHSYLLTVIDPDRNVYASAEDSILVSAEVASCLPAGARHGKDKDIEVFLLTETEKNSGIFRGYVNTQPGTGRKVQAVLEVMPGEEVRFGYVDIGNAKGRRNVVFELRLPVIAPVMHLARAPAPK